MTELHSEFNPCCCISVRAGTTLISLYDMIYGAVYLLRQKYVEALHEEYPNYFPENIPNPTEYKFMGIMFHVGNYVLMSISGVILLIATQYLRNNFKWLALLCYVWLLFRVMLEISFLIYLNALIGSGIPHFVRYGQELFLNFALQIYFIVVVSMYIRESRMEFNNMRAIKPINIVQGEHEEYLSTDRSNKFFNTATSFHFLTPQFYLHAKTVPGERLLADPSVLQYTLTKSIVEVRKSNSEMESESESGIDGKLDISTPTVTITHSPQNDVELNNEDSVGTIAPLKGEYKDQPRSSSDIIHQDASGIMLYSAVNDFQAIQDQSTVSLEELPSLVRAFNTKEQQDEYEKTITTNVKSGKESL